MENKDSNIGNGKQVMMISQQSNLSHELIFEEILTRLPINSILRFKSVSKQWYSTLSSSHFAKAHLKKSPFSHPSAPVNTLIIQSDFNYSIFSYDDEVDQVSHNFEDNLVKLDTEFLVKYGDPLYDDKHYLTESCNGLICITAKPAKYYFILWNPATRELNKYAPPDEYLNQFNENKYSKTTSGFGYVSSVDDYKFVTILTTKNESPASMFAHIFSLRENRWRKIDLDPIIRFFSYDLGVHVSEKLYWRAMGKPELAETLVSFDLATERFDVVEVDWDKYATLGVSKGCLHKLHWSNTFKLDILEPPAIMKSIELPEGLMLERFSKLIGFTKNDKLFVTEFLTHFDVLVRTLGIVDTSTRPMQLTRLFVFFNVPFNIVRYSYVPSLVSPFPTKSS